MITNKENLEKAKLTIDGKSWSWGYLIEGSYFDFDEEQIDSANPYGCEYIMGDGCWSLFAEKEPRTKEVYELCEYGDKHSNKVYDFEQGKELFVCSGPGRAHGYLKIENLEELFDSIIKDELLYVKSTKPIEWWEDAADYINTIDGEDKVEVEMFGKGLNKDQAQTAAMLMLDESHALEILENKYGADVIGKVAILLEQGE